MSAAADYLRYRLGDRRPVAAMVLGSGLGLLVDAIADAVRIPFAEIPGFPVSAVTGHAGEIVVGRLGGRDILVLSGRVHYYEAGDAAVMRPVIAAMADLGIERLLLTNSAGSVREDMPPGSVMMIEDHINYSGLNPLIGEASDARFVGMTAAYDAELRERLAAAAETAGETLFGGVYMWFSGPSFETPAEIRMARTLGADAVGMSTVPECILARHCGLKVTATAVITNLGVGLSDDPVDHDQTLRAATAAGEDLGRLITRWLELSATDA